MKKDYFWIKRIIECGTNENKHRPALLMLIKLFEKKWKAHPSVNPSFLNMSLKSLNYCLKQV